MEPRRRRQVWSESRQLCRPEPDDFPCKALPTYKHEDAFTSCVCVSTHDRLAGYHGKVNKQHTSLHNAGWVFTRMALDCTVHLCFSRRQVQKSCGCLIAAIKVDEKLCIFIKGPMQDVEDIQCATFDS